MLQVKDSLIHLNFSWVLLHRGGSDIFNKERPGDKERIEIDNLNLMLLESFLI